MALDVESITTVLKEGMPALEVLAGSKAVALFLEKISGAIGWYVEPKQIVRKARAEAAAGLIKAEAAQEEKVLEQRTIARIIYEETNQQQNIEAVVIGSLPNINESAKPENMDDDWLTNFFSGCRQVSNADMQKLWSQLLAQEVNTPGSFSVRTINALATLSKEEAIMFKEFSTFIWSYKDYFPVAIITHDMLTDKVDYKLTASMFYGLSDSYLCNYDNVKGYNLHGKDIYFTYNGKRFNLYKVDESGNRLPEIDNLSAGHMILTQIGRELVAICTPQADWNYVADVIEIWKGKGILVEEVTINNE